MSPQLELGQQLLRESMLCHAPKDRTTLEALVDVGSRDALGSSEVGFWVPEATARNFGMQELQRG